MRIISISGRNNLMETLSFAYRKENCGQQQMLFYLSEIRSANLCMSDWKLMLYVRNDGSNCI